MILIGQLIYVLLQTAQQYSHNIKSATFLWRLKNHMVIINKWEIVIADKMVWSKRNKTHGQRTRFRLVAALQHAGIDYFPVKTHPEEFNYK